MYTKNMIDLYKPDIMLAASPYPAVDKNWLTFLQRVAWDFNATPGRKAKIVRRKGNTYTLSVNEFKYSEECLCNDCMEFTYAYKGDPSVL